MRGRKPSSARLAESNSNAGQGRLALLVSTRWVNLSRVPSCSGCELSKARKVLGGGGEYLPGGGMEYPRCGGGSGKPSPENLPPKRPSFVQFFYLKLILL